MNSSSSLVSELMTEIDHQIANEPLSYEEAKEQFVLLSKSMGIKHAFTFDEMWQTAQELRKRNEFRDNILRFQGMLEAGDYEGSSMDELIKNNPVEHWFTDGQYIRQVINEPGQVIVTKIHKQEHPFFLLEGEMSILTEDGIIDLKAPHFGITKPGTKRLIFSHTRCKFITVHATDKTTPEEVEEDVIAKDFSDPRLLIEDVEMLKRFIK